MSTYLKPLLMLYQANADTSKAAPMRAYMKNKFEFFGIKSPDRKALDRQFLKQNGKPALVDMPKVVKNAYDIPQREVQYFVNDLISQNAAKLPASFLETTEWMIRTKSWWDTVDAIAVNIVGPLAHHHSTVSDQMDQWIEDCDIWIRRTAILYQLKYGENLDQQRLFRYCNRWRSSKEFFIRKSIGWALRSYSKTNPEAVIDFVRDTDLSGLSAREALKWVSRHGDL